MRFGAVVGAKQSLLETLATRYRRNVVREIERMDINGEASGRRGSVRSRILFFALLIFATGSCPAKAEKPAATMRDVQTHFKNCLQPFHAADGSQITVYFSVKRNGQIFGRPRAVWFGGKASNQDQKNILSNFLHAFKSCMPLQLNARMADGIPGKVYFLQFRGSSQGPEIIVRPYGSEGPPLIDDNW